MSVANLRSVMGGWSLSFYECWSDWMPWNERNWRNATFAHIDIEWADMRREFTFILFGVGFSLDWHDPVEVKRMTAMVDEWIERAAVEEGEEWKG